MPILPLSQQYQITERNLTKIWEKRALISSFIYPVLDSCIAAPLRWLYNAMPVSMSKTLKRLISTTDDDQCYVCLVACDVSS